jgi:hypothetical protein
MVMVRLLVLLVAVRVSGGRRRQSVVALLLMDLEMAR